MDSYPGGAFGPGATLKAMQVALEAWEKEERAGKPPSPPGTDRRAPAPPAHLLNPYRNQPPGAMVLRVYCRDLPNGGKYDTGGWNLDNAAFKKEEVRALLPGSLEKGSAAILPEAIIRRIARECLLDNVRDPSPAYADKEVEVARLGVKVIGTRDGLRELRFEGETRTKSAVRGYDCHLLGFGLYDPLSSRFLSLEIVAAGNCWGGVGMWHNYRKDNEPTPLGIALVLLDDGFGQSVCRKEFARGHEALAKGHLARAYDHFQKVADLGDARDLTSQAKDLMSRIEEQARMRFSEAAALESIGEAEDAAIAYQEMLREFRGLPVLGEVRKKLEELGKGAVPLRK
jgi:hypothetical protein